MTSARNLEGVGDMEDTFFEERDPILLALGGPPNLGDSTCSPELWLLELTTDSPMSVSSDSKPEWEICDLDVVI